MGGVEDMVPSGGDSACWLDQVCPECGALPEGHDPTAPCWRCGTVRDTPPSASPAAETQVLLTGFEPFAGAATNASWEAVQLAVPALGEAGVAARQLLLPVEFGRAGDEIVRAVRELRPRIVIAVGLAAGRRAVTPERVAVNVQDARIPDNAGRSPVDEPCAAGGPVGYWSSLPIKAMVAAAEREDVPAAVSQSAGTFVCNDVFYRLQHALATDLELAGTRGGFVHVPSEADLAPDAASRALVTMARTALTTEQDLVRSGGATH